MDIQLWVNACDFSGLPPAWQFQAGGCAEGNFTAYTGGFTSGTSSIWPNAFTADPALPVWTEAGRADPLLRGFPGRFQVFQWHGDTFDIPAGAELLAAGEDCPNQMFRRGSAAGVQFHLETTPGEAAVWARVYADEVRQFGRPPEELLAEIRRHEPAARELAERFVHNLVGWVGALQGR